MQSVFFIACVLLSPTNALMAGSGTSMQTGANPMRRIITMLQNMIKKVEEEGKNEADLFEKFMCYCTTGKATLAKSIEDAEEKIPQVQSDIKEAEGEKTQLDGDLVTHKGDREAATEAIAKATGIREKEAGAYAKESGEDQSNLDALKNALAAIEKGMAGGFLQTNAAGVLRQMSLTQDMSNADRDLLSSFLMGGARAPASGEIVGIMKQMQDTMEKDLAEVHAEEDKAKSDFDGLVAAKEKEIASATKAIEEKTKRTGEVAVEIINLKEDLDDTQEALGEDTKYIADLEANCATREKEWAGICKMRQEELIALNDVVKMLSDDDAQELAAKTVPSASASLLQLQLSSKEVRAQALKVLSSVSRTSGTRDVNLDLISLALHGKKVSFDKVITMIEDMVVLLGKEQVDDDNKKVYCENEFDKADDQKKVLELSISDLGKAIDEMEDSMKTLAEEIKVLEDGIIKLDREVAAATVQRKEEHADYEDMKAANAACIALIEKAKNRLQKFYNPKLYKAPPKKELTEEERIEQNMGGLVQLRSKVGDIAPPPPPPAAPGKTGKKGEEAGGVMAMMDMMKADVEKESQESEFAEKDAQGEYEQMVKDAAAKRATDSKDIAAKESVKAEQETELVKTKDAKVVETKELMATKEYISEIHADCDFLLEKYEMRKEARANEIDALKKAVAVLSGADFSLVQVGRRAAVRQLPL